ncbi:hypothetical protein SAMN05216311_107284 [Chitinophaga sp. CF418]|nr:hypothetical protein SAMN05216311_107284 [Chitinophaga sp. CF418]
MKRAVRLPEKAESPVSKLHKSRVQQLRDFSLPFEENVFVDAFIVCIYRRKDPSKVFSWENRVKLRVCNIFYHNL